MAGAADRNGQVQLDLRIELGRAHLEPREVEQLAAGSFVVLQQPADEPVDVYVRRPTGCARSTAGAQREVLHPNHRTCGPRIAAHCRVIDKKHAHRTTSDSIRLRCCDRHCMGDTILRRKSLRGGIAVCAAAVESSGNDAQSRAASKSCRTNAISVSRRRNVSAVAGAPHTDSQKASSGAHTLEAVFSVVLSLGAVLGLFFLIAWIMRRGLPSSGQVDCRPKWSKCSDARRWLAGNNFNCCGWETNCSWSVFRPRELPRWVK